MGAGVLAAAAAPETAFTSLVTVPAASGVASVTAEHFVDKVLPRQMKAAMQLHHGFAGAGELATGIVPGVYGAPKAIKDQSRQSRPEAGAYLAAPHGFRHERRNRSLQKS